MNTPKDTAHPICEHLETCKACPRMGEPYANQWESKMETLKENLSHYVESWDSEPSENLIYYRNRVEWWYDGEKHLGYRNKNNFRETFYCQRCQLVSPQALLAYRYIHHFLQKEQVTPYDVMKHEGWFRYVMYRESKTNSQQVVSMTTYTPEHGEIIERLATQLLEKKLVSGVAWLLNDTWSDTSDGKIIKEWGQTSLEEKLGNRTFEYGVRSFFQTNPSMAQKIQEHVVGLVSNGTRVLDLFSGIGFFSISVAEKSNSVLGVELGEEANKFAQKNAEKNNLENVTFVEGNVPKYLPELHRQHETYETVILDPPRGGLSKKIWRRVMRLNPKEIIYVSCNPTALKRDLEWLEEYGKFNVVSAKAFDMFPHTDHIEAVVKLQITTA